MSQLQISASSGHGIASLKETIRTTFLDNESPDQREYVAISRVRHRDALLSADAAIQRFLAGLSSGNDLELLALDLREALAAVGTVTGQVTSDDLLERIFSSFCIGK